MRGKESINIKENRISCQIEKYCGVRVMDRISNGLDEYNYDLRKLDINQAECKSFEDFSKHYQISEELFSKLNSENIGKNVLEEVYSTYKFLTMKIGKSHGDLQSLGINSNDVVDAMVYRLIDQVIEAGAEGSKRKLKNGRVIGLSKISGNLLEFLEVPYFAFACGNVSLDQVLVPTQDGGTLSLREIDTKLGSKNSAGEFFLPNSLGVSICMSSYNEKGETVFISQERNNAAVLSQNANKYIASASGGVPTSIMEKKSPLEAAVENEVSEELGLSTLNIDPRDITIGTKNEVNTTLYREKKDIENLRLAMQQIVENKLKIDKKSQSGVMPIAITLEEARRNPEVIFIADTKIPLSNIQKMWEIAQDKDESLSIKGITLAEIEGDLERRKKGETPEIDDHFFMSFLGFILKSDI